MRSNISCLLLAFLATTAALSAQTAEVTMRIDVVSWGDEIGGLSIKSGEKDGGITALPFQYSQPVSYSGPAVMEIYKNGDGNVKPRPGPSAEDLLHELKPLEPETEKASPDAPRQGILLELDKRRAKKPNLVALAQLPTGCRRATVLLAPAPGGIYLAYVIDDDPAKLPAGQIRIHNLSPQPVSLRCNGAATKTIKTRASLVLPATHQALSYDLAYELDGEWKFQEHNIIPVREDEQTQMIILRSANSFFHSADGSTGGFLQCVILRRSPKAPPQ